MQESVEQEEINQGENKELVDTVDETPFPSAGPLYKIEMLGREINDFEGETYEGDKIKLNDYKDKVLVLNFWFMDCTPCIAELDGMNQLVDRYEGNDDVAFISFTYDDRESLKKYFFPKHEYKFEIVLTSFSVLIDDFNIVSGYPTTMIVNKEGRITKVWTGGSTDKEESSLRIKKEFVPVIESCLNN